MSKKANIYSSDWCNLVFEHRNKNYGAFVIRQTSEKRHLLAVFFASFLFSIIVGILFFSGKRPIDLAGIIVDGTTVVTPTSPPPTPIILPVTPTTPVLTPPSNPLTSSFVIPTPSDDPIDPTNEPSTQVNVFNSRGMISSQSGGDSAVTSIQPIGTPLVPIDLGPPEYVEVMPSFPGGISKMYKWIGKIIVFPEDELSLNRSGKVWVGFIVDKDGSIKDTKVLRSVSPSFDQEALRVMSKMPNWLPGRQNGVAVAVKYKICISFEVR